MESPETVIPMLDSVSAIFWNLVPIIATIATPIILLLARHYVAKVTSKLDVENQHIYLDTVTEIVQQGITFAEQVSKKKQKELEYVDGNDKLFTATKYVIDEIRQRGLAEASAEEIQSKIESYLGRFTFEENIGGKDGSVIDPEAPPQDDFLQ